MRPPRTVLIDDSTQIDRVDYSHEARTMRVFFSNGDSWTYSDVNPTWAAELCFAESVGKHFNKLKTILKGEKDRGPVVQ